MLRLFDPWSGEECSEVINARDALREQVAVKKANGVQDIGVGDERWMRDEVSR